MRTTAVVILNWNGLEDTIACLRSLDNQTLKPDKIIVVDNGSSDNSAERLRNMFPHITLLDEPVNHGFAGGVNIGLRAASELDCDYVAILNNDAVATPSWLAELVHTIEPDKTLGIVTSKILGADGKSLDSAGQAYSVWGLAYSIGRGEADTEIFNVGREVFGASGGASIIRVSMLDEIGHFDESFFAYYEDVDISFRAQLAGWKIWYQPAAVVYHKIGASSSRIKGFTVFQTIKNQPLVFVKNVPGKFFFTIGLRLSLAQSLFFLKAISRGQVWPALKGAVIGTYLLPSKMVERRRIQNMKKVDDRYIWQWIDHDLPPNAHALIKLRALYWKLTFRKTT